MRAESVLPFKMVLVRALYIEFVKDSETYMCIVIDVVIVLCQRDSIFQLGRETAAYCGMEIMRLNIHPHRRTKQLVCTE